MKNMKKKMLIGLLVLVGILALSVILGTAAEGDEGATFFRLKLGAPIIPVSSADYQGMISQGYVDIICRDGSQGLERPNGRLFKDPCFVEVE